MDSIGISSSPRSPASTPKQKRELELGEIVDALDGLDSYQLSPDTKRLCRSLRGNALETDKDLDTSQARAKLDYVRLGWEMMSKLIETENAAIADKKQFKLFLEHAQAETKHTRVEIEYIRTEIKFLKDPKKRDIACHDFKPTDAVKQRLPSGDLNCKGLHDSVKEEEAKVVDKVADGT
ncbi:hypothetical protein G7Z17_g8056 [Cylindrodendrum hubeiense]|uniref:Uncharacterized protein n=1 Tax=Cylindrodendrum hubeiense TaxID=595255 RepID=A0A9P5H7U1_9HYPO|nr:hypothetical protein G7Z17_g8056 [Cylindrodendrum hubeiense]